MFLRRRLTHLSLSLSLSSTTRTHCCAFTSSFSDLALQLLDLLPFLEELATTQPPVVDVRPYLRSEFGVHTLIEQAQRKPPRGGGGSGGTAAAAAART